MVQKLYLLFQGEVLEVITTAIVAFFQAQPAMLDQIPQLGHIPKMFKAMTAKNDTIPKSSLQIIHELASSDVSIPSQSLNCIVLPLSLYILYFRRYDTYHDTHEVIFDVYQRYILSGFRPKTWYVHKFDGNFGILMTKLT